jgi:hypothetical protein
VTPGRRARPDYIGVDDAFRSRTIITTGLRGDLRTLRPVRAWARQQPRSPGRRGQHAGVHGDDARLAGPPGARSDRHSLRATAYPESPHADTFACAYSRCRSYARRSDRLRPAHPPPKRVAIYCNPRNHRMLQSALLRSGPGTPASHRHTHRRSCEHPLLCLSRRPNMKACLFP